MIKAWPRGTRKSSFIFQYHFLDSVFGAVIIINTTSYVCIPLYSRSSPLEIHDARGDKVFKFWSNMRVNTERSGHRA